MNNKELIRELKDKVSFCDKEAFEWRVADDQRTVAYFEAKSDAYHEIIRMLEGEE